MSRKVRPGACGLCGRAVVSPTPEALSRGLDFAGNHGIVTVSLSGHEYMLGVLHKVRCRAHQPAQDLDIL